MIEDLRFIKRYVPIIENGETGLKELRILQTYDGHTWFDVPLVELEGK